MKSVAPVNNTSDCARFARTQRHARKLGLAVSELGEREHHYWQYGPYMILDASTRGIVASALDLDQVEDELRSRTE